MSISASLHDRAHSKCLLDLPYPVSLCPSIEPKKPRNPNPSCAPFNHTPPPDLHHHIATTKVWEILDSSPKLSRFLFFSASALAIPPLYCPGSLKYPSQISTRAVAVKSGQHGTEQIKTLMSLDFHHMVRERPSAPFHLPSGPPNTKVFLERDSCFFEHHLMTGLLWLQKLSKLTGNKRRQCEAPCCAENARKPSKVQDLPTG